MWPTDKMAAGSRICGECWQATNVDGCPMDVTIDALVWAGDRAWLFASAEIEAAQGQARALGDPGPSGAPTNRRGTRRKR